jgi:hypothetical protein
VTTNTIQISVEVGYDLRSVELTPDEWGEVQNGQHLVREVVDYYEGEKFTYVFAFNDRQGSSLVVTYDDADGFEGNIGDAIIEECDRDD